MLGAGGPDDLVDAEWRDGPHETLVLPGWAAGLDRPSVADTLVLVDPRVEQSVVDPRVEQYGEGGTE